MGLKKSLISKIMSLASAVALAASAFCFSATSASAESGASDAVKANEKGVVRIECVYGDEELPVLSRTGFIINNTTVVTSKEILGFNAEEILRRTQGNAIENYDKNKLKFKVKIGKVYVNATNRMRDTEMQFAILGLESPIDLESSTYNQLALGNSDKVETTQTVYSIGFATNDDKYIINEGKVTRIDKFIQFTMPNPVDGFIGSPVINEGGAVVALTYSKRTDGYDAVPINEVISVCNDFGIQKTLASESDSSVTSEVTSKSSEASITSKPVPEESLNSEIVSQHTQSSFFPFEGSTSVVDIPEQKEDNTVLIIVIVGIGVVVVALIAVMIVIASRKKPSTVSSASSSNYPVPSATQPKQTPPQAYSTPPAYTPPTAPNNSGYNPYMSQGAGETTVLDEGAGETTVLGGGATAGIPSGVLVNSKTGERIIINKPEFAIGKERSRVDYCISDDNSVSRLHLKIRVKGGRCYVVDMGSKNGTYINGSKLVPNQEMPIHNGDKLKISMIEFEFKG